jgi:indole-3-glycerol phosphate synthase
MPVTLDQILASTRGFLPALRLREQALEREAGAAPRPPSFAAELRGEGVAVIAEVKRQSPSAGLIRGDLDPAERAATYAGAGAAAISVLTDGPFFGGSIADLRAAVARVRVPVLRKDFILDELQIVEARAAGAAAVLLIVRALERARLESLIRFAATQGLDALVEVHSEGELTRALEGGGGIIGVNSRDLDTFRIDIPAAWKLLSRVPADRVAIAESGMKSVEDVERAAEAGADAVLIGTALSAADAPETLVARISKVRRRGR